MQENSSLPEDYHAQYDQGEFLSSLERTRRRQARLIAALIQREIPDAGRLVDFGAGRGWFLEGCRDARIHLLAGMDTSPMSMELARSRGFEWIAIPPPEGNSWEIPWGKLSFLPRILTFLDVVEHLPSEDLVALLRQVLSSAGRDLELVVVKVPVSSGLLYRVARALAGLRATSALEQLYQAGTFPPHFNYFSPESLHRLFAATGLRIVAETGDPDFEPGSFGGRVEALRRLPSSVPRLAGAGLLFGCRATGLYDSMIVLARPVHDSL